MSDSEEELSARFGTFTGVFTPTLLTILGVIMYVRMGWVVGNAGLAGSIVILVVGIVITLCTGLSLSSIATNTRIGHGGPYAIMNRSLGLEVGGSIGIPLFLTRPLGVAMYIFGFREGLQWIFPNAPSLPVDLAIFAVLFGIAFKSADLAFKTQYGIMVVIALSLVSIFASPAPLQATHEIQWWGEYRGAAETGFEGTDFWGVFAVFFPATTGILAGANMSGDLKDPRRAIPVGTLAAIAVSAVIYIAMAFWVAQTGTLDELTEDYNWIIDHAWSPTLVLLGLLGATASSALAGLVGGPRILMAMGQNGVVPFGDALAKTSQGEPRNAMMVTGVLTIGCIMMRDLNAIAPLVTMFFLITYCMINVVVLFEDALGLVSYRPTLRVPRWVPFIGLVGCLFSMFIVNPTFGLISVGTVIAIYVVLHRRGISAQGGEDVQSTIFVAVAQWAASKVRQEDLRNPRLWKPNVLIPVHDTEMLPTTLPMVANIVKPEGTLTFLGICDKLHEAPELRSSLQERARKIHQTGIFAAASTVAGSEPTVAIGTGLAALSGSFFRPNLLFIRLDEEWMDSRQIARLMTVAAETKVGVVLYHPGPEGVVEKRRNVRIMVRGTPGSWDVDEAFDLSSLDLVMLLGYRIDRLWRGELSFVTVVPHADEIPDARAFQDTMCDLARLPQRVNRLVPVGEFSEAAGRLPPADLTIFGLGKGDPDPEWMKQMTEISHGACLFVRDGGQESARV